MPGKLNLNHRTVYDENAISSNSRNTESAWNYFDISKFPIDEWFVYINCAWKLTDLKWCCCCWNLKQKSIYIICNIYLYNVPVAALSVMQYINGLKLKIYPLCVCVFFFVDYVLFILFSAWNFAIFLFLAFFLKFF